MKIGPNIDVQHVIVCDDIRTEANGKQIVIGVYASSMEVPSFPARLLLAYLVRLTSKKAVDIVLEIRLLDKNGTVGINAGGTIKIEKANTLTSLAIPQVTAEFPEPTTIRLQMREPGSRWKTVQETEVIKHEEAS